MLKVFSVYDSKVEAFILPFYSATTASAKRSFDTAANKEGHDFARHGADYTLFELGEFDESTGDFKLHPAKINLGSAIQFIRPMGLTLAAPMTDDPQTESAALLK